MLFYRSREQIYVDCLSSCLPHAGCTFLGAGIGAASGALAALALKITTSTGALFGLFLGIPLGFSAFHIKNVFSKGERCRGIRGCLAVSITSIAAAYGLICAVGRPLDFSPTALYLSGTTLAFSFPLSALGAWLAHKTA